MPDPREGQSETSARKQRPVGIREFRLLDVDENYEPPEKPHLRVQLIGDVLSLVIETCDEGSGVTTYKRQAQIVVDVEPFWNGLRACLASGGRKDA